MFAHGDRRAGCTAGRFSIHSAMASFMREASVRPPREAPAGPEGQQGRGQPWSSHWHHKPSQAGPEGRAGLPHRLAAVRGHLGCRPAPGCRCRPAGLLLLSFELHLSGKSSRRRPALQASYFSQETSPCSLLSGSTGTRWVLWAQGLFRSPCSPTSMGLWVPGPGVGLGGVVGEENSPSKRVLGRVCQYPLSGRGPPGPTINISSAGGILRSSLSPQSERQGWRDPSLAALV